MKVNGAIISIPSLQSTPMINITLLNANELITKLSILQQANFIFRGHSSGKYRLEPGAFRKDILKKWADIHLSKTISKPWRSSNEVKDVIKWWGQGIPTQVISRVFDYIMHLMHYNFALNTVYLTKKDGKDTNDQRLLAIFPEDYWLQEDTFVRFFQHLCMGLPCRWDERGNILQKPFYLEETTGLDQSLPQHYHFETALLDWSYNPLVAIYFSLGLNETRKMERGFYMTSHISSNPTHLSILAYQQITTENTVVKIEPGASEKNNKRLKNQEGTFTRFTNPLKFYLEQGCFPTIEGLYNRHSTPYLKTFELVRYNLERTAANIQDLKEHIEYHGINEAYLFPDPAVTWAYDLEPDYAL